MENLPIKVIQLYSIHLLCAVNKEYSRINFIVHNFIKNIYCNNILVIKKKIIFEKCIQIFEQNRRTIFIQFKLELYSNYMEYISVKIRPYLFLTKMYVKNC